MLLPDDRKNVSELQKVSLLVFPALNYIYIYIMGFLKHLLRSASEIIREISIMIDTEIVRNCNCLSTFDN